MGQAGWSALWLSLQVAGVATLIVALPAAFVAYALARFDPPGKRLLSSLLSLPMVLPPTAVGFLLLQLFATHGPLGRRTLGVDLDVLLTWKAAVVASAVMSAPLVIGAARVAFEGVDPRLEQMARTLGHRPAAVFVRYTLPLAGRGLLAAGILGFTRALGEFGATVTIAGNIPGRTQTLAAAIFSAQQAGNDAQANVLLCVALAIGVAAILASERLAAGMVGRRPR